MVSMLMITSQFFSFLTIDYVDGSFHKDAALAAIASPEVRTEMYYSLINTLAKIHAVDVDKVGLHTYGKRVTPSEVSTKGYIARQIRVSVIMSWKRYCLSDCCSV